MDYPQQHEEDAAIITWHLNLLQTSTGGHCLLDGKAVLLPSLHPRCRQIEGSAEVLGMWTAELIPLSDDFQIPG